MRGTGSWEVRKMGRVEEKEGRMAVGGQLSESRIFADSADGADFGDFCLLSVFVRMARLETLTVWGRKLESLRYKHQRSAAVSGRWSVVEVRTLASGEGAQTGKFAVQTSAVSSGQRSVVSG